MTRRLKVLITASVSVAALAGANPAMAAGTNAGVGITNNVTVNFEVGGNTQTAVGDSDTFTVDRKINFTVEEANGAATSVSPNSDGNVLTFTVTNTTNSAIDVLLSTAQQTGGAAAHGGTDSFDATGLQIFVDSNDNGVYDEGVDTATSIDNLAEDDSIAVFVVGSIPISQITGDIATVQLIGTAADAATGVAFVETTGANTAGIDNVFADADGDGVEADFDDYLVAAAALTVVKSSTILWDPINGSTNPKFIPGAIVEYCIAVSNAAGGAAASDVAISDTIPSDLSYYATTIASGPATIPAANGVISALACDGTGTNGDASALAEAGGVVSGNLGTVAAGATETLIFRSTID